MGTSSIQSPNIVNAPRFDRECFGNDTDFADWAQSRARHTLAAIQARGQK